MASGVVCYDDDNDDDTDDTTEAVTAMKNRLKQSLHGLPWDTSLIAFESPFNDSSRLLHFLIRLVNHEYELRTTRGVHSDASIVSSGYGQGVR